MTNENYAEWLVRRKVPAISYLINFVMIFLTGVSVLLALTMGILGMILMFVVGFLAYISFRNSRVEYEYLFVSRLLSIDTIYGQAKRKKTFECSVDEIKLVAPSGSNTLKDYHFDGQKTMDFTSHLAERKVYEVIVQKDSTSTRLLMELNEKMLQCMRQSAPSKIVI